MKKYKYEEKKENGFPKYMWSNYLQSMIKFDDNFSGEVVYNGTLPIGVDTGEYIEEKERKPVGYYYNGWQDCEDPNTDWEEITNKKGIKRLLKKSMPKKDNYKSIGISLYNNGKLVKSVFVMAEIENWIKEDEKEFNITEEEREMVKRKLLNDEKIKTRRLKNYAALWNLYANLSYIRKRARYEVYNTPAHEQITEIREVSKEPSYDYTKLGNIGLYFNVYEVFEEDKFLKRV